MSQWSLEVATYFTDSEIWTDRQVKGPKIAQNNVSNVFFSFL